jgi:hypothetical protein
MGPRLVVKTKEKDHYVTPFTVENITEASKKCPTPTEGWMVTISKACESVTQYVRCFKGHLGRSSNGHARMQICEQYMVHKASCYTDWKRKKTERILEENGVGERSVC